MKLGILLTSVGNFAPKGFYNSQEIGLIKKLAPHFANILLYKAIPENEKRQEVKIEGCNNVTCYLIPTLKRGSNGLWNCDCMDSDIDVLIYFSDTQLAVKKVYNWCHKNKVMFLPYIGVVESHSNNKLKKIIMDFLLFRTIDVYKKSLCLVKTPSVKSVLEDKGVKNTVVVPVGLDTTLLYNEFEKADYMRLKQKYGYKENDKVILFVGRMIDEKRPIEMIELFKKVIANDSSYKLLMVGKGELYPAVRKKIEDIEEYVQMIEQVPNKDMWELYCMADCFVNLNPQEIFGMSLLEAMYYKCRVIAWRAPGPEYIIKNESDGIIVDSEEALLTAIMDEEEKLQNGHDTICKYFTWDYSVKKIIELIQRAGVI